MEKTYDKEGNLIQVTLSKSEQFELARENNKRIEDFKNKDLTPVVQREEIKYVSS